MGINLHWRGILWFIVHIGIGTIGSILIRILSDDFHPFQIVFLYMGAGLLFLLPWVLKNGVAKLKTTHPKTHVIRSAMGTASFVLWTYGLATIPLANAAALAQSTPLLVTLLAILFLSESCGKHRTIALIIGFVGALIILKPGTGLFDYSSLFVLGAVAFRAISDIVSKNLLQIDSALVNGFYLLLGTSIFSLPIAIYYWKTISPEYFIYFILCGIVCATVVISMLKAYEHEDLTILMPFSFFGLIFMFVSGYIFFDEIVDISTAIGGSLIILSSIYMLRRRNKKIKEIMHDPGE